MMGVCNDFFQQLYHTSMWYSCYLIIRKLIRPVKTPHLEFLSVMYVRNVINCTRPSCIVDLILRPHHSSLMSHLSSHHPLLSLPHHSIIMSMMMLQPDVRPRRTATLLAAAQRRSSHRSFQNFIHSFICEMISHL